MRDARHGHDGHLRPEGSDRSVRRSHPLRIPKPAPHAARLADAQGPRLGACLLGGRLHHHGQVCTGRRVKGFAQPPQRQHPPARDLTRARHQHIEVSPQLRVLKPIIEQVHRGTEHAFGQHTSQIAIGRDADAGTWHGTCQHQRLVTGLVDPGSHAVSVCHNHHPGGRQAARIAAAENGRPMPLRNQPAGERGNDGRLARPSDGQVPDADDGALQAPPHAGGGEPPVSPARGQGVETVRQSGGRAPPWMCPREAPGPR